MHLLLFVVIVHKKATFCNYLFQKVRKGFAMHTALLHILHYPYSGVVTGEENAHIQG